MNIRSSSRTTKNNQSTQNGDSLREPGFSLIGYFLLIFVILQGYVFPCLSKFIFISYINLIPVFWQLIQLDTQIMLAASKICTVHLLCVFKVNTVVLFFSMKIYIFQFMVQLSYKETALPHLIFQYAFHDPTAAIKGHFFFLFFCQYMRPL